MTTRYFYAIFPDPDERDLTVASAALMKAALQLRGRMIPPQRLHLTCHFVGACAAPSADVESRALEVGDRVELPSFRIGFDLATSLGDDERAACVFTASIVPDILITLQARLSAGLADPSSPAPTIVSRAFLPHVTWLYSQDRIHGAMPVTPFAWNARRLVLARSADGERRYRILRDWALR